MKKIVLIQPQPPESFWTLKSVCEYAQRPALTPSHYDVQIIDEAVEPIDFEIECDLAGISGYTVHNERMIEIAERFQKRGILTVAGGAFCLVVFVFQPCRSQVVVRHAENFPPKEPAVPPDRVDHIDIFPNDAIVYRSKCRRS